MKERKERERGREGERVQLNEDLFYSLIPDGNPISRQIAFYNPVSHGRAAESTKGADSGERMSRRGGLCRTENDPQSTLLPSH